jgi:hypothetical protein
MELCINNILPSPKWFLIIRLHNKVYFGMLHILPKTIFNILKRAQILKSLLCSFLFPSVYLKICSLINKCSRTSQLTYFQLYSCVMSVSKAPTFICHAVQSVITSSESLRSIRNICSSSG